jgi:hypothetical protein
VPYALSQVTPSELFSGPQKSSASTRFGTGNVSHDKLVATIVGVDALIEATVRPSVPSGAVPALGCEQFQYVDPLPDQEVKIARFRADCSGAPLINTAPPPPSASRTTIPLVERIDTDNSCGRTHRDRQFLWLFASTPTISRRAFRVVAGQAVATVFKTTTIVGLDSKC